jgi:hypothetical protein
MARNRTLDRPNQTIRISRKHAENTALKPLPHPPETKVTSFV